MKFILAPDSFKGTLSAVDACEIMHTEIVHVFPCAEVVSIPIADGGEGTVDAFLAAAGGQRIEITCAGPYGKPMRASYGILADGTAVVELAACAGLPLVSDAPNPEATTTYGVGELITHAAQNGAKRIILGLGGSATTDGGCGMAAALGVRFYDSTGCTFIPTGATLEDITRIDTNARAPLPPITAMCDVTNPLLGETGAAVVFSPQKGANAAMAVRLEAGLIHLAAVCTQDLSTDVRTIPGGGAAGGAGAGCVAFLGAHLQSGIETLLDITNFDTHLKGATAVFTGEGKIDSQSIHGKAISGIARAAHAQAVPIIVLAGAVDAGAEAAYTQGVTAIRCINPPNATFAACAPHTCERLAQTMQSILATTLWHPQNATL